MNANLIIEDFKEGATPRTIFSHTPRMTIRNVFDGASHLLPKSGLIRISRHEDKAGAALYPYATAAQIDDSRDEPTRLAYRYLPGARSIYITRVNVCNTQDRGKGVGAALFGSQYPLWRKMNILALTVLAHEGSAGFYRKLGFDYVASLPDHPADILIPMRLDFKNVTQHVAFARTIVKAPPLTSLKLAL